MSLPSSLGRRGGDKIVVQATSCVVLLISVALHIVTAFVILAVPKVVAESTA